MERLRVTSPWRLGRPVRCAAGIVALASAAVATQSGSIEFVNQMTDTIKVCAYHTTDTDKLFPIRCFTLDPGKRATWPRSRENDIFRVGVWRPGLLDHLLCSFAPVQNVKRVIVTRECELRTEDVSPAPKPKPAPKPSPPPSPAPPRKYSLLACNAPGAPVQFALAYSTGRVDYVAEGWWIAPANRCLTVALSDLWKKQGASGPIQTYIYAKSGAIFKQYWEGTESDPSFCVDQRKAFVLAQYVNPPIGATWTRRPCVGESQELVRFLRVSRPDFSDTYYYTFEN